MGILANIFKSFHQGLYTVCEDINTFQGLKHILINYLDSYLSCDPLVCTMKHPKLIVSNRWKNSLVYKGLMHRFR